MIRIREAIIVEGRYDKNTLAQVVDAPILETSGFGIFHDSQRLALLRWPKRAASSSSRTVTGRALSSATICAERSTRRRSSMPISRT